MGKESDVQHVHPFIAGYGQGRVVKGLEIARNERVDMLYIRSLRAMARAVSLKVWKSTVGSI